MSSTAPAATIPLREVRLEVLGAPLASPVVYSPSADSRSGGSGREGRRWWSQTLVTASAGPGGAAAEVVTSRRWASDEATLATARWLAVRRDVVACSDAPRAVAAAMHGAAMLARESCAVALTVGGAPLCVDVVPPLGAMDAALDELEADDPRPPSPDRAAAPGPAHAAHCVAVVRDSPVLRKTLAFLRMKCNDGLR